nr:NAD(P)-dependent oxidoreductase [Hydrogenispora ethanolica]
MWMILPELISNEEQLDEVLGTPSPQLTEMMRRLDGDIMILGIGGKMGASLGAVAINAIKAAGVSKKVIGVARFSDPDTRKKLNQLGIETISCDLLDRQAVAELPRIKNIIFMVGRKFGTDGNEELTWAINTLVPHIVAEHFTASRIVVFSTGNVYPLVPVTSGGCSETDSTNPLGEYAQSCLGRERIFGHFSKLYGTPLCLYRLNYAIDLRYGVLYDIGRKIWEEKPVDLSVSHFNAIWQGDACNQALLCLEYCTSPANVFNITGPESIPVRYAADIMAQIMGKKVTYSGNDGSYALLANSAKSAKHFGYPTVSLQQMLTWTAHWLMLGGRGLNKPTHFDTNNGRF